MKRHFRKFHTNPLVPISLLICALIVLAIIMVNGCGQSSNESSAATSGMTSTTTTGTSTTPYARQALTSYRGIDEPRADGWQDMTNDASRLLGDGFNIAAVQPPVLTAERGGLRPRVILEGQDESARHATDELHQAGLAVQISPTTQGAGLNPQIDTSDAVLSQLTDDTLQWAQFAQDHQVEVFSPLAEYNLVLGSAADQWSNAIVPQIRQKYNGTLVAKVLADVGNPPPAGAPHDFESLNYKGYDYLMVEIYPRIPAHGTGNMLDQPAFSAYVDDVMNRANAIVQRDGLKGVIVEFGSWRTFSNTETVDGPALGDESQAQMAASLLQQVMPRSAGVFFHGWTLPDRGARDNPVEAVLRRAFTGQPLTGTTTEEAPGTDTVTIGSAPPGQTSTAGSASPS